MEYLALYDVYIFVITPESSSYPSINHTWNIFDSTTFSVVSQNSVLEEDSTEDDWEFGSQQSESFTSLAHDQGSQHVKRDLIMVISCFFHVLLSFLYLLWGVASVRFICSILPALKDHWLILCHRLPQNCKT